MPNARRAFVPHPVLGRSSARLRAYIDGSDPVSGRPLMQEVFEGLTQPVDEQLEKIPTDRRTPRLVDQNTEEHLHAAFLDNGWTDTLPIVLPTEKRVAAMLAHTSHPQDEVVGHMGPAAFRERWKYTVEKVAVNAVMAGALPEYFPVILAIAGAAVTARDSSSSSMASMVVVNGPIRHEIGMNSGIGAMGPYNHANTTIGRAYGLLSQNLQGGSIPGLTYMGTQGNSRSFTNVTFAENEEQSPWEPFHVQHGFGASESTVSIFAGCVSNTFGYGLPEPSWQQQVTNMLLGGDPFDSPPTFLLDPLAARFFVERGFETKEQLIDWAHESAVMTARDYWNNELVINHLYPRATFGEEPWASMLAAPPDALIRIFQREQIDVVVVGGGTNAFWSIMGAHFFEWGSHSPISVDEWR